jgi:hypothetical protein
MFLGIFSVFVETLRNVLNVRQRPLYIVVGGYYGFLEKRVIRVVGGNPNCA